MKQRIFRVSICVKALLLFTLSSSINYLNCQTFLNGSFEINTAVFDQINLDNASFNGFMSNTIAYGSFGNMDIVTSDTYCNGPQSGDWFVCLTGGETDAITMELSSPLVAGQTYSFSFWDRACTPFSNGPMPVQLGITNTAGTTGNIFYTAPISIEGQWTERLVTFTAPVGGLFISASLTSNGSGSNTSMWAHVDNFAFETVSCPLSLNLGADQTICTGQSLLLDATLPDATYLWQDDSTEPTLNVNSGGTYSVTATVGVCNYTDEIVITEISSLVVDLGDDTDICPGESITFDATTTSATYLWQDGTSLPTYISNSTESISVIVSIGDCSTTDTVNVNMIDFPSVDLGSDINACIGTTVILDGGNPNYSYSWQDGNSNQTYSTSVSGLFVVEYTDGICTASDQILVTINPNPVVLVNGPFTVCAGEEIQLSASGLTNYLWSPDNLVSNETISNPTISTSNDVVITVQGQSAAGCSGSAIININVIDMNISGNPLSGGIPLEVQFATTSEGGNFNWNFGDGETYVSQDLNDLPIHVYYEDGSFEAIISSSLNNTICFDTLTIVVYPQSDIIKIPNIVTANNRDGNDTFRIESLNLKTLDITIFNRWGNEVGKITKPNEVWSATDFNTGTYYYVLLAEGLDGKKYNNEGSFTVIKD